MTLLLEMLRKVRRGQVLLTTDIMSSVASRSRQSFFSRVAVERLETRRLWPSRVSFSSSDQSRAAVSQPGARTLDLYDL